MLAAVKFLPLVVFAILVISFKLDILVSAPISVFAAVLVFMFVSKKVLGRRLKLG